MAVKGDMYPCMKQFITNLSNDFKATNYGDHELKTENECDPKAMNLT